MDQTIHTRFWNNLNTIQGALTLSDQRMSQMLGISENDLSESKNKQLPLSVTSVIKFASECNMNFSELFDDGIDVDSVQARYKHSETYIPERYATAAYSKRRTCINVLAYSDLIFGPELKKSLLRKFKVSENIFLHPDENINILFLSDICKELKKMGVDEQTLFSMGTFSAVTNYSGPVGQLARSIGNAKEIYEKFFTHYMHFFDRNSDYTLTSLKDGVARVRVEFTEELKEGLRSEKIANSGFCTVRAGVGCSFPMYLGLPIAQLTKTKCIHQGDDYCLHDFDFSEAQAREAV